MKEVEDLTREQTHDKMDLLDTIRMNERDLAFFKEMSMIMMTEKEIDIIKSNSQWDQEKQLYNVPLFNFK